MATSQQVVRAARAALIIAFVLMIVGTCGFSGALVDLSSAVPPAATLGPEPELTETVEAVARALAAVLRRSPLAEALATANALVSAMLVVGAVLLLMRRSSAPWWIGQAAAANAIWTVVDATSGIRQLLRERSELLPVLERLAVQAQQPGASPALTGNHFLWMHVVRIAGFGLLQVVFFAWIAFRVRRPDVRELLVR